MIIYRLTIANIGSRLLSLNTDDAVLKGIAAIVGSDAQVDLDDRKIVLGNCSTYYFDVDEEYVF